MWQKHCRRLYQPVAMVHEQWAIVTLWRHHYRRSGCYALFDEVTDYDFTLIFFCRISVGGIVRPSTFVELRFCEFAPESRAFFGVKNCENGPITFEVIWIHNSRASYNLIMPYTLWKTKTRQTKSNSSHWMKFDLLFMGLIRSCEDRTFIGAQPTSNEFTHKKTPSFCEFWGIFIFGRQHFRLYAQTSPELLVNLESGEFCEWTQKWYLSMVIGFFSSW